MMSVGKLQRRLDGGGGGHGRGGGGEGHSELSFVGTSGFACMLSSFARDRACGECDHPRLHAPRKASESAPADLHHPNQRQSSSRTVEQPNSRVARLGSSPASSTLCASSSVRRMSHGTSRYRAPVTWPVATAAAAAAAAAVKCLAASLSRRSPPAPLP